MNKIDFVGFIAVNHANPNGDPLAGNLPRTDNDNYGEISDVCLKRKMRNAMQDAGNAIFVKSDDNNDDGYDSLRARLVGEVGKEVVANKPELIATANSNWLDTRAFGAVMAYKGSGDKDSVSAHIRGCVSISPAFSVDHIETETVQITKSVNGDSAKDKKTGEDKDGMSSDRMGTKHRVKFGLYRFTGSILPKLAARNNFSDEDVESVIASMKMMFENDISSARPSGSMELVHLYVVEHDSESGKVSTAAINRAIKCNTKDNNDNPRSVDDYEFDSSKLMEISGINVCDVCEA